MANITGTSGVDILTGTTGNDIIDGLAGDDILDGGLGADVLNGGAGNDRLTGGAGADVMSGGGGSDSYYVDDVGDVVIEVANGPYVSSDNTDRVYSSVSFALSNDIEFLSLTGAGSVDGTGNALDNALYGNAGNNVLRGEAGNDTLGGGPGSAMWYNEGPNGVDTLIGGLGDDRYFYSVEDTLVEGSNQGIDTIVSATSVDLANFANFENITLEGATPYVPGPTNLVATGNGGDNVIVSYHGSHTLIGGDGDDTYSLRSPYLDYDLSKIVERAGEGTDTIEAYYIASVILPDNVENLFFSSNSVALTGVGNDLDNTFSLDYRMSTGGQFASLFNVQTTFSGLDGNDTYQIDYYQTGIVVVEAADEGIDTVESARSYTLTANVENLVLQDEGVSAPGLFDHGIAGTGNALDNAITGNKYDNYLAGLDGDDVLAGRGGNDTLSGGDGDDTFLFRGNSGSDIILDFSAGDLIVLSGYAGISSFADLQSHMTVSGSDTLITLGTAKQITVMNVAPGDFDAGDFAFIAPSGPLFAVLFEDQSFA